MNVRFPEDSVRGFDSSQIIEPSKRLTIKERIEGIVTSFRKLLGLGNEVKEGAEGKKVEGPRSTATILTNSDSPSTKNTSNVGRNSISKSNPQTDSKAADMVHNKNRLAAESVARKANKPFEQSKSENLEGLPPVPDQPQVNDRYKTQYAAYPPPLNPPEVQRPSQSPSTKTGQTPAPKTESSIVSGTDIHRAAKATATSTPSIEKPKIGKEELLLNGCKRRLVDIKNLHTQYKNFIKELSESAEDSTQATNIRTYIGTLTREFKTKKIDYDRNLAQLEKEKILTPKEASELKLSTLTLSSGKKDDFIKGINTINSIKDRINPNIHRAVQDMATSTPSIETQKKGREEPLLDQCKVHLAKIKMLRNNHVVALKKIKEFPVNDPRRDNLIINDQTKNRVANTEIGKYNQNLQRLEGLTDIEKEDMKLKQGAIDNDDFDNRLTLITDILERRG